MTTPPDHRKFDPYSDRPVAMTALASYARDAARYRALRLAASTITLDNGTVTYTSADVDAACDALLSAGEHRP